MIKAALHDLRVLVVEDEYLIAEAMSRALQRAGATVLGPVSSVSAALHFLRAEESVDAAVLDINLGEQKVYPVVDVLVARGAQCVFATGNDAREVPKAYASVSRCEKPVETSCLVHALVSTNSFGPQDLLQGQLVELQEHLFGYVKLADAGGQPLLAAKLSEALDLLDGIIDEV